MSLNQRHHTTSPNSHEELSKQRRPGPDVVVVVLEVDWIRKNKAAREETV